MTRGTSPLEAARSQLRDVYQRQAGVWDAGRDRSLFEKGWLDRLLARTAPGDTVLDVGCGAGEPIARYIVDRGRRVCGVDFSEPMLALAQARMPHERWLLRDMRELTLGRPSPASSPGTASSICRGTISVSFFLLSAAMSPRAEASW